jgi:hypothetical protein
MKGMDINYLDDNKLVLFEAVSGSRAYGTATETSDTDTRGVFILPQDNILGMHYTEQVNNTSNDTIFYEARRFLQLLSKNNPNIMELLFMPKDSVLRSHPIYNLLLEHREEFITKQCAKTFGGYAIAQIKKARGMNKKIVNPIAKERKTPLDFCYMIMEDGYSVMPLNDWLKTTGFDQMNCGLANIPHMRDMYSIFHDDSNPSSFRGIVSEDDGNELRLSSIPEGRTCFGSMNYNKDGYSKYCKDYKLYWDWVEKRNPARYNDTVEHGKGYDGKNLGHCHRLLDMAIEIGSGQGVNVRRPNREELLSIRRGEYDYDELIKDAEEKLKKLNTVFDNCNLPKDVDSDMVDKLLIEMRHEFHLNHGQ